MSKCPVQKLYMEVRHAVKQLYVKLSGTGASAGSKEWYHALDGGLRREPANQDSLPGPCGGHSLHLHPKQAEDDATQPHLPKASAQPLVWRRILRAVIPMVLSPQRHVPLHFPLQFADINPLQLNLLLTLYLHRCIHLCACKAQCCAPRARHLLWMLRHLCITCRCG